MRFSYLKFDSNSSGKLTTVMTNDRAKDETHNKQPIKAALGIIAHYVS
jgi:hypothetical protein